MRFCDRLFVAALTVAILAVCGPATRTAAAQPHAAAPNSGAEPKSGITGKVVETMNAGSYTYVQVDDGSRKLWAAAPQFAVATGDTVVVPDGMPMHDFYSKTLDRTFPVVYFVADIQVKGGAKGAPPVVAAHPGPQVVAPAAGLDFSNLQKPDGGHTVAELFADKSALVGKQVTVRGRVVKSTSAVMGKNWIHVQDGTGAAGNNDLAVVTGSAAAVGDKVLVRGTLNTDKDFGYGYRYDVILEDATVTVE